MKAMLALEAIGYEAAHQIRKGIPQYHDPRKWAAKTLARNGGKLPLPWVAEIIGRDEFGRYEKRFVNSTKDFAQANGTGNRGVRFFFLLESGRLYQVQALTSWTNKRRYFCRVSESGEIEEIPEEEARRWVFARNKSDGLASPSTKPPSKELSESLRTFLASILASAAAKTQP